MKRNYKYEKEMLHWLDGGEIEQKFYSGKWGPFSGIWADSVGWEYRIAKPDLSRNELIVSTDGFIFISPAEKPKEERWLYVNKRHDSHLWIAEEKTEYTIGKIRMEDV